MTVHNIRIDLVRVVFHWRHHPMELPKKPLHRVITFKDAQSAINGTLETWLPRLVESNDALEEALLLLRDLYFSRGSFAEEVLFKRVEEPLKIAATAKSAF